MRSDRARHSDRAAPRSRSTRPRTHPRRSPTNSINPYSKKLGPDELGEPGNTEYGVVLENRHLEYLDPNYGPNLDDWEEQMQQDYVDYAKPSGVDSRSEHEKAMFESIGARESGPAKRPIGEWADMMMNIYRMARGLNVG